MKNTVRQLRKYTYVVAALALGLVTFLPGLGSVANAAQVSARSIKMSSATPGATGVTYLLTFTPVTTEQELIVDFCGDTPIVGATCAFTNATTPVVNAATSSAGAITFPGTNNHTIRVTGLTMTGATPYTITFSNITNPTSATSFYARILTYATGTSTVYAPAASTGGSPTLGSYIDYGGDALSTATLISVQATVMETLTFTLGTTTITLGHGTPPIIDTTAVDIGSSATTLSTNAQSGAVVNMKASNTCANGGLSSTGGAACNIPGIGGTAATITNGAGRWGLCIAKGANTTVTTNYNDSVNNCPAVYSATSLFGMNGTNLTGTYGDQIFSTAGPVNAEVNTCRFVATAAATTQAGVYTANESLIATGTF